MKKALIACLLLCSMLTAWSQSSPNTPTYVLRDVSTCMSYYHNNIKLSRDFTATDERGKLMSKGAFLKALQTGKYLPLQVPQNDKELHYKLYLLRSSEKDYGPIIGAYTQDSYWKYQMEGKKLPPFKFIDINGKVYTNQNTLGEILVLKAWFLACTACVTEIPELDQLTDRYKNRKDIVFVSVLPDDKPQVKAFLAKKPFGGYAHVAGSNYFEKTLQVSEFPTHFIINKQGIIVKVLGDAGELAFALDKEARRRY